MQNMPNIGTGVQASNQLWNPLVMESSNTEFNPLSYTYRHSPECWKMIKNQEMSLVLELVLQVSSQLWNPLVTEDPNTDPNLLSHNHRSSPECMEKEEIIQNEPNIGAGALSIQPT